MPRFSQAAPDIDSRKALQERARAAISPVVPEEKGRWPFPAAKSSTPPAHLESPTSQAEADDA
jgi:hypothetical protein